MANKNEMKHDSGSNRDKTTATPKQNKWADPFYNEARGFSRVTNLYNHKIDSIRDHVTGNFDNKGIGSFLKSIWTGAKRFFGLFSSRKGIA